MYLIVTLGWLAVFGGNIMAHPNGGMDAGFGLGGPPPASVTTEPPVAVAPGPDDVAVINDRPVASADDLSNIDTSQASPASFDQASPNVSP